MVCVVDSGRKSALEHMQIDTELLLGVDSPLLRFYDWSQESITYGYFIDPANWLHEAVINRARRPTGGGLIFHEGDFSFTLALPLSCELTQKPVIERYKIINSHVLKAVYSLLPERTFVLEQACNHEGSIDQLCMANPTAYDLLLAGKKVGGSAQRKNKQAFIHQCSLFLLPPSWERIGKQLLDPQYVLPKLQAFTGSIFSAKEQMLPNFRTSLMVALEQSLGLLV